MMQCMRSSKYIISRKGLCDLQARNNEYDFPSPLSEGPAGATCSLLCLLIPSVNKAKQEQEP